MDKNRKFFELLREEFYTSRKHDRYEAAGCIADAYDNEKDLDEYNASVDYRALTGKIMDEAVRLEDAALDAGLDDEASELSRLYYSMQYNLNKYGES